MSTLSHPDVFISYAADDNVDGGIAEFFKHLSGELRIQTGKPSRILFRQSRTALPPENWDPATILVAMLTPSYFGDFFCRRDLEVFLDKERKLGRSDLIIPIQYVDTAFMTDHLLMSALTHHLYDWRALRFESFATPRAKEELARIARDIRDRLLVTHAPAAAPVDRSWRIETLSLTNFRCFETLELDFRCPSTLEGDWTCIAGINGAGKSSIIQAIGIALLAEGAQDLETGLLARMRRVGMPADKRAEIDVSLTDARSGENREISVQIDEKGRLRAQPGSVIEGCPAVAYGATRNLATEQNSRFSNKSREVQRMIGVFEPLAQLATAESLVSGWRKNPAVFPIFSKLIDNVFGRELAVSGTSETVRFAVNDKDSVDALDLPDGFRSSAAWLADLCETWCETHPEQARTESHTEIDAIVLIDEIDLHLHPSLQRELVPRLRRALPKVQWIVTTHSPLVLANFDANEIVALDRDLEGNVRPVDRQILGFTSDQIYDWLMGTRPTGAAMEEELRKDEELRQTDGGFVDPNRIAELMRTGPETGTDEARDKVKEFREILKAVKRRA